MSIWLEMGFTSKNFHFKHQFALIIYKQFKNKNEINIYINKSLRNFFWKTFPKFVAFGIYCMSKKHIFDLHQRKVLCYTQFKMYSTLETHILTKSTNCCEKNLEMIESIFSKA